MRLKSGPFDMFEIDEKYNFKKGDFLESYVSSPQK